MSDIAIRVENLSKRYRIGVAEEQHDTFVGAMLHQLRNPARNLRRLRGLSTFSENGRAQNEEDVLWALKDVSFDVKRGEVVGVIGRNGAGKSTLLKILSRITHPTSGRVELHGRVGSLLEVGTGFHPELTGRENVYLNGTILGMRKDEIDRKFDEIVDFSGIEKFIDTPVKRYSSGMAVRLAFAVAANLEPEILLVDEVLAVGDLDFQRKCLAKMDSVANLGTTVLIVSHNMASILGLCSRAILVRTGQLAYDGVPDQAIKTYKQSTSYTVSGAASTLTPALTNNYRINRVSLFGSNGRRTESIILGDTLTIQIEVQTPADRSRFTIGVAFFSSSGVYCYGLNNYLDGVNLVADSEHKQVSIVFNKFSLLDDHYALTVALYNENGTVAYEVHNRRYVFTVSSNLQDHGFAYLPHTWMTQAGVTDGG